MKKPYCLNWISIFVSCTRESVYLQLEYHNKTDLVPYFVRLGFVTAASVWFITIQALHGFSVKQYWTPLPFSRYPFKRVLICILNIPNAGHFVNFWYTYMNGFYFTAMTKICDLQTCMDCIDYLIKPLFLCIILNCFVLYSSNILESVLLSILLLLLILLLSWLLRYKMQISCGNW